MSPELRKAIRKTITFMEKHPWCTGSFQKKLPFRGRKRTHYCMLGAFAAANKYEPSVFGIEPIEDEFVNTFYAKFGIGPVDYNDRVATKKERVIGKLRRLLKVG